MRVISRFVAGGLAAVALAASASCALAAQTVIDQKGLKFIPNAVTINAGDTVLFTNSDPFTHDVTVVGPNGAQSDKGLQHHGESKVVSFPDKGTFSVICTMHPNMKATVTVK
jgi:plastocyanin